MVGLLAGWATIVLRWLISAIHWLFFDLVARLAGTPGGLGPWPLTVLAPAVGMVIVSWMVRRWAPEARGHGVPEVQFAVRMRGGRIRPRVAAIKALASSVSIGSGGSVGREGPIAQIGSSLGSWVGQVAGLRTEDVRILVAAGAAGAIGSTFNAPIGGVLFATEVILGSFAARSFGLVVVSAVTATAAAQVALGQDPAFRLVEEFALVSEWEFLLYLILGLLAGGVALVYVRSIYGFEELFHRWRAPEWIKALSGGLIVGVLGTFGSELVFGIGHEGVELALAGGLTAGAMAGLVLLKTLATSITLGAGGSGGVFAPALFIGAMTGGVFGRVAGGLLPALTASSGAYALVGAGAVFGAAAHAPLTAIVILFEMTDNYRIILPLMFAVVLAQLIASRISPDSIYSIKLRRLGGYGPTPLEVATLDMLLVADAMSDEVPSVPPELPLEELARTARTGVARSWVVLDEDDRMVGIVSVKDLEQPVLDGDLSGRTVSDVMTASPMTCNPGETLREAFRRFSDNDVYQIPVLDPDDPERVVGVLRRTELLWAFKQLSDEQQRLLARRDLVPTDVRGEAVQIELEVSEAHERLALRSLRDFDLPDQAIVALLRRGDRVVVPRGFTRVEPGDVLTLLTTSEHEHELRAWIERQIAARSSSTISRTAATPSTSLGPGRPR